MSGPRNSTTGRGGARFYSWRGANYWSVTTIIGGGLPKPALVYWAANEVAAFACDNLESLASLLESAGREATYDMLKRTPWRKKEKAGDLGTLIHQWIEAHRLGKPMPACPPEVQPYLRAFEQFVRDFSPVYEATEASVYNRTQSYAGTLDAIVSLTLPLHESLGRYVLDAKSGKGIYPEVGLQLAAYRNAEFIGLPDGSEVPMPETDGGLALHLTPGGYRLIEVRSDEPIFRAFLYCRENYRFMNDTSKTVLGLGYANDTQSAPPLTLVREVG